MAVVGKKLPEGIIVDILLRLPAKPLVRFKCVSQSWLEFITRTRFPQWHANFHRDCSSTKTCLCNQSSVIYPFKRLEGEQLMHFIHCIGGGQNDDDFMAAVESHFPPIQGQSFVSKSNCCDGMVCLNFGGSELVLWNPSIREYKTLPLPEGYGACSAAVGLGYDSNIDGYKLVTFTDEYRIRILRVKTRSWKDIGELPYDVIFNGIHVKGRLYSSCCECRTKQTVIACIDLAKETFRVISLPPFEESRYNEWSSAASLFILLPRGGSLCIYREFDRSFWIMKEEKVGNGEVTEAWTKLMTIPEIEEPQPVRFVSIPRCFTKNGSVFLVVDGEGFVMYDTKKQRYEKLQIHVLKSDCLFSQTVAYTESLVSPESIMGKKE